MPRWSFDLTVLLSLGLAASAATAQTARETADARKQIRRFASDDKAEIRGALKELLGMGEKAVPALVTALGDRNAQVANYASGTLSRIGAPAIPALEPALGSPNDQTRQQAYAALVRMGELAVPAAERAARSATPRVRQAGLAILKKLGKSPPADSTPEQPTPPKPDEPQPTTPKPPVKPEQPADPSPPSGQRTKVPTIRGEGPKVGSFPGEQSKVDAARDALGAEILERIAAHVEAGEQTEARVLLWGIWTQAKRERVWARRQLGQRGSRLKNRLFEVETRYQRARDLCYGSAPVFKSDDGAAEVAEHLRFAQAAARAGDLSTLRAALSHANARQSLGGVDLGEEGRASFKALLTEYNALNKTASSGLFKSLNALSATGKIRDGAHVESQLHQLWERLQRVAKLRPEALHINRQGLKLLQTTASVALGIKQDLEQIRPALRTFAADAPDPDFADNYFAQLVKSGGKAERTVYDAFMAALRVGVYADPLWEAWDVDGVLYRPYLGAADASLARAERHSQRDERTRCDGELKRAASLVVNAATMGAPESEVARRTSRQAEIVAQQGVGKLRRALSAFDKAAELFTRATQQGSEPAWRDGAETLTRGRENLAAARKAGVSEADDAKAGSRLNEVTQLSHSAGSAVVHARLAEAQGQLEDAAGLLAKGDEAWLALTPLSRAERRHAQASAVAAELGEAGTALEPQLAALAAKRAGLEEQILQAQRLPADVYAGSDGAGWRSKLRALIRSEREWEVLGLTISSKGWKDRTAKFDYAGGGNTRVIETRWYRELFAWVAVPHPEDATRVELRKLGFRLHKFTDGSYRMLKLWYVEQPIDMLKANLPK